MKENIKADVLVKTTEKAIAGVLNILSIGDMYDACILNIEDGNVSVNTFDQGKLSYLMYDGKFEGDIIEKGGIPIEAKPLLGVLSPKYTNEKSLVLEYVNKTLKISNGNGKENELYPPDVDDCRVLATEKTPIFDDDGWLLYAKKGSDKKTITEKGKPVRERCKSRITISLDEIKNALLDMESTNSSYISFHFANKGSYSQSGHWGGKKSDKGKTPLSCKLEGEELDITLSDLLKDATKIFENKNNITIQGNKDKRNIVLSQINEKSIIRWTLTQPTRPKTS